MPTGFEDYSKALRVDLRVQLLSLLGATKIKTDVYWENVGNEAGSAKPPDQQKGLFQRIFVDTAGNFETTPAFTRHFGAVIIEIYDDLQKGAERIEARAEAIAAKLRRRYFITGRGRYMRHEYKPVGRNEELARYQGNLRVEWNVFETL